MSKLTTVMRTTIASLMLQNLDPRKSLIDDFKDEVLRILPRGTEMVGLKENSKPFDLYRTFELTFDCPFFKNDFEFEVEFHRQILSDGEMIHQYDMATKIINLTQKGCD